LLYINVYSVAKVVAIIPQLLHQSQTNQVPSPAEDDL